MEKWRTSLDACPVDCIHPKKDEVDYEAVTQLYIDPIECIDCGACVPVCPVSPYSRCMICLEKWAHFAEMNSQYFKR
jgi:NAD-dependent dihydropyrimidine dehydrogenase PreA subunit